MTIRVRPGVVRVAFLQWPSFRGPIRCCYATKDGVLISESKLSGSLMQVPASTHRAGARKTFGSSGDVDSWEVDLCSFRPAIDRGIFT